MKHIIKTIRNAIFLMIYGHFVEYDANGKCIHYKDSDGDEYWRDADGTAFMRGRKTELNGGMMPMGSLFIKRIPTDPNIGVNTMPKEIRYMRRIPTDVNGGMNMIQKKT